MRNKMILLAVLMGLSLPAFSGTLVFEAEEEEEITIVEEKPIGASTSVKRVSTPIKAAAAGNQKIRCRLADGSVVLLTAEQCKRKQTSKQSGR